jgi:hypothetical protein
MVRAARNCLVWLALTLVGCDTYSVLGAFVATGDALKLSVQTSVAQQNQSIPAFVSGGVAPFTYAVLADDVFPGSGAVGTLGGDPLTYQAGSAIGLVRLRVFDAQAHSADTLVTTLPPAPTSFAFTGILTSPTPKHVDLTWAYASPALIDHFEVWRAIDQGTGLGSYAFLASVSNTLTVYTDPALSSPSWTYLYRLYAVAGSYRSLQATP